MNFLDRNTLPKFQERLDLAASELNDMEEIICKAINELAGRIHIINNLVDKTQREDYAEETNYLILDTLRNIQEDISILKTDVINIKVQDNKKYQELSDKYFELEERLNALDDAAARKEDLNVVLYRTGDLE